MELITKYEISAILRHLRIGNGCWEWQGNRIKTGYARIYIRGKGNSKLAHRTMYELVNGQIPEGLEIDHLCRNRGCVRPDHLEAVSHAENIRRSGPFKKWTHCAQGHPLSGGNLKSAGRGRFKCRVCWQRRERERYARRTAGTRLEKAA